MFSMDTYLRRTYFKLQSVEKENFPFWDYRSRRGVFSSSNSSFSSSNSSSDGSSVSSMSSSSRLNTGSESISISEQFDTDSLLPSEQQKMTIHLLTDTNEISTMERVYQPIEGWIDPDLHILKITDKLECFDNKCEMLPENSALLPSMAVVVFVRERGALGFERIQTIRRHFEKNPWKFHHSEHVQRGAINPYPYNSQEFYYTTEGLPLFAVRQVHTGKEFFRTVLFVSQKNWLAMVQFYKLILNNEPDLKREDFCLFSVTSFQHFDIQLALKKLQSDTNPRVLGSVKLQFRINDIRNIVSFLPKVCKPISDILWITSDNDGNSIALETPHPHLNRSFNDSSSLSERCSITGKSFSEHGSHFNSNGKSLVKEHISNVLHDQHTNAIVRNQASDDRINAENGVDKEYCVQAISMIQRCLQTKTSHTELNMDNCQSICNNSDIAQTIQTKPTVLKSFYV